MKKQLTFIPLYKKYYLSLLLHLYNIKSIRMGWLVKFVSNISTSILQRKNRVIKSLNVDCRN